MDVEAADLLLTILMRSRKEVSAQRNMQPNERNYESKTMFMFSTVSIRGKTFKYVYRKNLELEG